ncbi:hypothetical protein CR513_60863, partial [Mucuna pruriens]
MRMKRQEGLPCSIPEWSQSKREVVLSSVTVAPEENEVGSEEAAPSFTPVRRNLLCVLRNRSVNKEERSEYTTDITKRGVLGGGVVKREAFVFVCKLVGMVDGVITSMAESCFICRAEQGGHLRQHHLPSSASFIDSRHYIFKFLLLGFNIGYLPITMDPSIGISPQIVTVNVIRSNMFSHQNVGVISGGGRGDSNGRQDLAYPPLFRAQKKHLF